MIFFEVRKKKNYVSNTVEEPKIRVLSSLEM